MTNDDYLDKGSNYHDKITSILSNKNDEGQEYNNKISDVISKISEEEQDTNNKITSILSNPKISEDISKITTKQKSLFDKAYDYILKPFEVFGKKVSKPIRESVSNYVFSPESKDFIVDVMQNIGETPDIVGYTLIHGKDSTVNNLKFTNFIMSNVGGYYAQLASEIAHVAVKPASIFGTAKALEIASKVSTQPIMEALKIPETFPINEKLFKYSPQLQALASASGADLSKAQDLTATAIFADSLILLGLPFLGKSLLNKFAFKRYNVLQKEAVIEQNVADLYKEGKISKAVKDTITEAQEPLNRVELAKQLGTRTPDEIKQIEDETRRIIIHQKNINDLKNIDYPSEVTTSPYPKLKNNESIINGEVYANITDPLTKTIIRQRIRKASVADVAQKIIYDSNFMRNTEKLFEVKKVEDLLGPVGNADAPIVASPLRQILRTAEAITLSPRNTLLRPLWLLAKDYEHTSNILRSHFMNMFKLVEKYEGTDISKLVMAVADGAENADTILSNLPKEGLALLKTVRRIFDEGKDLSKIPEKRQLSSYAYHVWLKDKTNMVDSGMADKNILDNILNEKDWKAKFFGPALTRKDAPGYELDIVKVARVYIDQLVDYASKLKYIPDFQIALKELWAKYPMMKDVSLGYVKNYFGVRDSTMLVKVGRYVKSTLATGQLSNNLRFTQDNLWSGIKMGFSFSGNKYFKGWKYFRDAFSDSPNANFLRNVMENSGLMSDYLSSVSLSEFANKEYTLISKVANSLPDTWKLSKKSLNLLVKEAALSINFSEFLNRMPQYLGEYMHIYNKLTAIKELPPNSVSKTLRELKRLNIDPLEDIDIAANRYAQDIVAKTHSDMGNSGLNELFQDGLLSTLFLFTKYPAQMAETYVRTFASAIKALSKPRDIFKNTDFMTSMRILASESIVTGLGTLTGYNVSRLLLVNNFELKSPFTVAQVSRFINSIYNVMDGEDELSKNEVLKSISLVTGMPTSWVMIKGLDFYNNATINRLNNKNDGTWNIYDKLGRLVVADVPVAEYLSYSLTPISPKSFSDHYDNIVKLKEINKKQMRVNNAIERKRLLQEETPEKLLINKKYYTKYKNILKNAMEANISTSEKEQLLRELRSDMDKENVTDKIKKWLGID